MTQQDQVISVMEQMGGFATLGDLYQQVEVGNWKAKDPYASIRRIVQAKKCFSK